MNDYLSKPVETEDLFLTLKEWLAFPVAGVRQTARSEP